MTLKMTNFFGRSSKLQTMDGGEMEDITSEMKGITFDNYNDSKFSFEPTAPTKLENPLLENYLPNAQLIRPMTSLTGKENTPPTSPAKSVLSHQNGNYGQSPRKSRPSSPTRKQREIQLKANSPKTRRLATVCQMYFLDYYYDMFDYVISRRERLEKVQDTLMKLPEEQREIQWRNYTGRERALLRKRRNKPRNKDFNIITQVGQGGYGAVYLAKKKDTKEVVALKVLSKRLLLSGSEARHVLTERDILTNTRSEWLVKLFYAFQDADNVYMAMQFVPGGDFRTLLLGARVLNSPQARYYISEMFAAVNSLHELGYTHRDLKPENFLIDATGHIKLTDFGLAAGSVSTDRIESMKLKLNEVKDLQFHPTERSIKERRQLYQSLREKDVHYAHSVVGSPDYMALEVLEGKAYDYTIDYWSLGCMLFEILVGYPPFSGASSDETYHNLRKWKETLRRPRLEDGRYFFSDRTWNLISRCIASPKDRVRDMQHVMALPYFAEVDWSNLRSRKPPFVPDLDNEEDAGYFDDFNNEQHLAKYKDVMLKREEDERKAQGSCRGDYKNFIGFTFKHKNDPNSNPSNILSPILDNQNVRADPNVRYQTHFGTLY
ncbi:Ser/Thr kinase involved in transcription and stress response [Komagataella phaffii GS115]|uniref:non-specific serine/threonine protein kinase n=2 Tax=Komagataella phaffii TaxID=460519 RepID=C4R5G6_KOMPG|nr:Ser/Thr kinase involved in transcription and stress response [Komagataella phaffii GS115]CAY70802.1 Ser/Thr kinase involved in transcription and stress response [Komagataella phaffii GS115]